MQLKALVRWKGAYYEQPTHSRKLHNNATRKKKNKARRQQEICVN